MATPKACTLRVGSLGIVMCTLHGTESVRVRRHDDGRAMVRCTRQSWRQVIETPLDEIPDLRDPATPPVMGDDPDAPDLLK